MASLIQGLLDKVNAASFSLRRNAAQDLNVVPETAIEEQHLAPVCQAFGVLSVAQLKVRSDVCKPDDCIEGVPITNFYRSERHHSKLLTVLFAR